MEAQRIGLLRILRSKSGTDEETTEHTEYTERKALKHGILRFAE